MGFVEKQLLWISNTGNASTSLGAVKVIEFYENVKKKLQKE